MTILFMYVGDITSLLTEDNGHFNLSAKSQSKCSSILYFVHINSCLLVLDTLRSASNCISCLTSDQYEAILAFLIPQFCVHDMKVLQ